MRKRKLAEPPIPQAPFALLKVYSFGPPELCVAALELGDAYFILERLVGHNHLAMSLMKKAEFGGIQFKSTDQPVAEVLAAMKDKALQTGATLEAIQLLKGLVPLSKDEEDTMAQAGTKLSRKAQKEEAAPEPKAKSGRKGNPEALAKARAARGSDEAKNKPYKVLAKENPAREGSWTYAMLEHILGASDTDGAKASLAKDRTYKEKRLDFGWAAKKGYIKF